MLTADAVSLILNFNRSDFHYLKSHNVRVFP